MHSKDVAVKVDHLTKSFRIPLEASNGIKQKIINLVKGRKGYRDFTPLKDISFEIKKGEFFGIVGRNGSGKSTLLKSLAGIYEPNSGTVSVEGNLIPFIELGVGFNPELSGRENVFLNGALLGFSRKEMEGMYESIVDFAELHDFMDERLKNYSSGMQVRLAFSIAIRAEGDILLLDEVLAVGDEAFQRKCYNYFDRLKKEKRTVILVTHDMSIVERFCSRAMMLESGVITSYGRPDVVARTYTSLNSEAYAETKKPDASVGDLSIKLKSGKIQYQYGDTMTVGVSWISDVVEDVGVTIMKQSGEYIFGTNTNIDNYPIDKINKKISYDITLNLSPGDYFLKAGTSKGKDETVVDFIDDGPTFIVDGDSIRWGGMTHLAHEWSNEKKKN